MVEKGSWEILRTISNATLLIAEGELEELVEFCKEPRKGSDVPANNPLVRNRLAQLAIEIDIGRVLSYFIIWSQIKGGLVVAAPMAAMAKVFSTELMQRLTYTGCQIMGLYGQVKESKWAPRSPDPIRVLSKCCLLGDGLWSRTR
jgi:alkylation response protein AidB-like acyl-CoA dehydrogenase